MSSDHHHDELHIEPEGDFEFTNGKMAMWLFLVSDAMAFVGFLGAYMALRIGSPRPELAGSLQWLPDWGIHLDVILTGLNTFVLICSSVSMVKAFSCIQDGNVAGLKKWLLMTIAGGTFFVGFQVYEWREFIHEGVTVQGLVVPGLDVAIERAGHRHADKSKLAIAKEIFGGREYGTEPEEIPEGIWPKTELAGDLAADAGPGTRFRVKEGHLVPSEGLLKLGEETVAYRRPGRHLVKVTDFHEEEALEKINTLEIVERGAEESTAAAHSAGSEAEAISWPSADDFAHGYFGERVYETAYDLVRDFEGGDYRRTEPGAIHNPAYGIPQKGKGEDITTVALINYDATELRTMSHAERAKKGARIPNLFCSSFYLLTGFHGLHVLIGVIYLWIVYFQACRGKFTATRNSPVEIVGLYWHFVDLVWVLIFMIIYLI